MPAESMTFNSLVNDIIKYAERTDVDFIAQVPRFIMLAQFRLITEFRGLGTKKYVTGFFDINQPVVPKPAEWRETASWNVGTGAGNMSRSFLFERGYEFCRTFWPDPTQTGTPRYYADYDYGHFLVVPTPASAFPFELSYYEQVPQLSDSVATNWFTDHAPPILLYACLLEAMPFLKNDQRGPVWQSAYDRALKALNWEDLRRTSDVAAVTVSEKE